MTEIQLESAPTLPADLRGMTPRSVPPEMWDAPSVVQTRRASWITLAVGIVLTTLGFLPIMQTWGLYFLPLAYLVYIGAAVVLIALGILIRYWTTGGNLKYVEKADAAMARIQEVQIVENELNGVKTYTPHFTVQYDEPARFGGEPVSRQQILASPAITAEKLAVSQLRFEAGDWLPVVWFPEKADTTAKLYDTLGLNETGIWTTQENSSPTPLWMSLSLIVLGGLMFFSLLWSLWSMGSYSPIAAPSWNVIALSVGLGVLLGAVMAGLIIWQDRHEKRRTQAAIARNRGEEAASSVIALPDEQPSGIGKWFASIQGFVFLVAMTAGAIGLPSLIVHQWLVSANALLDASAGKLEAVEIEEMIQVTHAGIFREYKIEYRLPERGAAGDGHSMLSTPDHMSQFEFAQAVAVVKQGAFGWEWVSEIIPLQQVEKP